MKNGKVLVGGKTDITKKRTYFQRIGEIEIVKDNETVSRGQIIQWYPGRTTVYDISL